MTALFTAIFAVAILPPDVTALGSPRYAAREIASGRFLAETIALRMFGARPSDGRLADLAAAADSPDLEMRVRATEVLKIAVPCGHCRGVGMRSEAVYNELHVFVTGTYGPCVRCHGRGFAVPESGESHADD